VFSSLTEIRVILEDLSPEDTITEYLQAILGKEE